jgi:arabinofuranan 3-O-arabinosyltransferase
MATLLTRPDDSLGSAPPRAGDGGPDGSEGGRSPSLADRVRWATVCLGFLALTLSQQPGRIVTDTKLDLTIDPWGWLDRALTLWEPEGYAGEVQNQAYGYLFPMGPFFGVAHSIGVPGWIAQRLWMALLLSLAFLGVVALARRLNIGTPAAQLVGGLAYALAPRMLMGLGATSIEVLPMALAPWVLVPLVTGSRRGSPRRAAALSGLAVFCVGGVNAVATSAVLPLAVLWLLTRPAGARKRRLTAWWIVSVALATAWWTGPLLLLGRYSPPFLDYIETAQITTVTTGLLSTLRGTTQWVAYLVNGEGPLWPTGWALVHDTLPIVATVGLAVLGLVGLARSRLPERTWLVLGLLAGLGLVTLGHLDPVQGLLAGPLHDLLDGPLAPMRNVHKFDPVLRLPLALGVTYVCGLLFRRLRPDAARGASPTTRRVGRYAARAGIGAVVLALLATVSPAVGGRLSAPTGFESIPNYWRQTADWLADSRPSGRALLLPASSTGTYFWGSTSDEPMQALADSEWTVRSAIPLSAPAHIRVLNAVEDRLSRGEGSAGLAGYLARAGISHLVVRNDLDFGAVGATRSILVEQALRNSPGIREATSFGPLVPSETSLLGQILDDYLMPPRPAVVVYEVADPAPVAYATPLRDAVSVTGGPDALLQLEDRGLVSGPALLADGGSDAPGTVLVGDAQVRRERAFGRTGDAVSAALAAGDEGRIESPERDYGYPGAELSESVVRYEGGTPSASSSASDADNIRATYPENQPYAALDGDPTTAWRPADRLGEEQAVWWRVDTDRPLHVDSVVLRLAAEHPGVTPARVRITTDAGSRTVRLAETSDPQRFELPAGPTSSITIGAPGETSDVLALAEVEIPGLSVERTVVTPAPPGGAVGYAFDATNPARSGCVSQADGQLRCSAALVRGAEETVGLDRAFTVDGRSAYDMAVTVVPRPGAALDALIASAAHRDGLVVTASSAAVPDPRGGADAAVDANPETTWIAAADDARPSLTFRWPEPHTVDGLRLGLLPGTAAAQPTSVAIGFGGLAQDVAVDLDGVATFDPITTDTLTVSFPLRDEATSFDPYFRAVSTLGVGVSELGLTGLTGGDPDAVVDVPCGQGPTVTLDGRFHQTALRTTLADLRQLQPVDLVLCDGASTGSLGGGEHRLVARSTAAFTVSSATLVRPDAEATAAHGRLDVDVQRWDREDRAVRVGARAEAALLVVPESVNPGWVATLAGAELETRTVDGWQQGYVLPAGAAGVVHLEFRAGAVYHAALAAGAGAVLVLFAVLLLPVRGGTTPGTGPAVPAGRRRRLLTGAALAAGIALVGGITGLAALAAALVLAWFARDRRQPVLAVLVAVSLGVAGLVFLLASGSAAQTATQVLALVAVASVVASLWAPGRGAERSGTRFRQRRIGRSTSR